MLQDYTLSVIFLSYDKHFSENSFHIGFAPLTYYYMNPFGKNELEKLEEQGYFEI